MRKSGYLPALAVLLALIARTSQGQTWDGGGNHPLRWSDPLNWEGDVLPVSGSENLTITARRGTSDSRQDLTDPFVLQSLVIDTQEPQSTPEFRVRFGSPLRFENLGSDPTIVVNAGRLRTDVPIQLQDTLTVISNVELGRVNFVKKLSGTGGLVIDGVSGSTAVLNIGRSDYTGGTFVRGGELLLYGDTLDTGHVEVDGGVLNLSNPEIVGSVKLINGEIIGTQLAADSYDVQAGAIAVRLWRGSLTKTGPGNVLLTGPNDYFGGTTIAEGTLTIGPGGQIPGAVVNNGFIHFTGGGMTGAISGPGAVQIDAGEVVFDEIQTFTGGTTVNGGVLTARPQSLPGVTTFAGGRLDFDTDDDGTFANTILGSTPVRKLGSGRMTLAGANPAFSQFEVMAGSVVVKDDEAMGAGPVTLFDGVGFGAGGGPRMIDNPVTIRGGLTLSAASDLTLVNVAPYRLEDGQTLRASGGGVATIQAQFTGSPGSAIAVDSGTLVVGDSKSIDGFQMEGEVQINAGATLQINSAAFYEYSLNSPLAGGTLAASTGVSLRTGNHLVGYGAVEASVAALPGSTIQAVGGDLEVGSADALDGFFSDGVMRTAGNTITVFDKNEAVLGSLTTLGDETSDGRLVAGAATNGDQRAHFLLEPGKNVSGHGDVEGNFVNRGHVIGDGDDARIVFPEPWTVSGDGEFVFTRVDGVFAPGRSIGVATGANQAFAGSVQIEIAGGQSGAAVGGYDQIVDAATLELIEGVALEVKPLAGFVPGVGDEFEILRYADGIAGRFSRVLVDWTLLQSGINFELDYGPDVLTMSAVAFTLNADFNGDGRVDGLDLQHWKSSFGLTADADADGDGDSDGRDFLFWQRLVQSPVAVSVPEPSTGLLVLGIFAAAIVGGRRRFSTQEARRAARGAKGLS